MKIKYLGTSPVDIPGHDNVEPGQTVDVADDVAVSLLGAGASHTPDGVVTPPESPLWVKPGKSTTTSPAAAGEEA